MLSFADFVRASSSDLSLRELLQRPVTELLGVGEEAADALKLIGVTNVFDLGSSGLFAQASAALAAASSPLDMVAGDMLDPTPIPVTAEQLPGLPLARLKGLSDADAAALAAALEAPTIRDLALWPPRIAAHELVGAAAGTNLGGLADSAEELRPRLGEYATERVYYDTLVMLGTPAPINQTPLTKPLSLSDLATGGVAFGSPAVGAVATYAQSWFAQGVTLGHMLHSLALAPGEVTRVAVIDWARRTTATATESIEESERLDNAANHARAISEVQNAVADEMQSGGSIATGWSKSTSHGSGFAGSVGGGIAGVVKGVAGVFGFGGGGSSASQESETNSLATSASWSVGSRSVLAEMNQRVNDRTEQHSTSVRNRRATAVREVSQTEHEQVSTRIVANYNHMHALTIQYYEVVQIYRVTVKLHQFVRALFLPFDLLDFSAANGPDLVARFRSQLLASALTPRAADLLLDDQGRIEVKSAVRVPLPLSIAALSEVAAVATMAARSGPLYRSRAVDTIAATAAGAGSAGAEGTPEEPRVTAAPGPATRFLVTRPGPVAEILPGDVTLVSIAFEDVGIDTVRLNQAGVSAEASTFAVPSATDQVDFPNPIPLRVIESIEVKRDASQQSEGSIVLRYDSEGHRLIAVVPMSLSGGTNMQKVAYLSGDAADRRTELLAHLQMNRSYYTRAVLERLDAPSLALLLSGVTWNGKPLADQVEARPVAIAGNFVILRAPAEDRDPSGVDTNQTWKQLREERGIDFERLDTRLVPIPTGGVFAEAVLGRSNSAEKLDITRFWNWQDSPIPIEPPEIAAVGTGSRATSEDLRPGQLGAPVVNLMAPTGLPEPAGLSAALGALATGTMFRDMSGLAGTQAAAQAASAGTLQAATEAGRIASENYRIATNQATQMGQAAADMWKVWKSNGGGKGGGGTTGSGSGGSGGPGSAGISGDGARVNLGRDLDNRGVSGAGGGSLSEMLGGTGAGSSANGTVSGDFMPPAPDLGAFSRERAFADEAAAASPDLIGRTRSALGGVNITPASFNPANAALGPLGMVGQVAWQLVFEQMALAVFRSDAEKAGVSLKGVLLVPMRFHRNDADFKKVEFTAWTNSSTRIYVNLDSLFEIYDVQIKAGAQPDDALGTMRATAVLMLRHESVHIADFKGNGDRPPTDYKQMVKFEEGAYKGDATFINSAAAKKVWTELAADPAHMAAVREIMEQEHDFFKKHLADSADAAFAAMTDAELLPKTLNGKPYKIEDLYKP